MDRGPLHHHVIQRGMPRKNTEFGREEIRASTSFSTTNQAEIPVLWLSGKFPPGHLLPRDVEDKSPRETCLPVLEARPWTAANRDGPHHGTTDISRWLPRRMNARATGDNLPQISDVWGRLTSDRPLAMQPSPRSVPIRSQDPRGLMHARAIICRS